MIQTDKLIPQFAAYLQDTLRRSPRTIEEYRKDLQSFVMWSSAYLTPIDVGDVSEKIIAAYVADMSKAALSPATIRRRLSCLRSFYRWLSLQQSRRITPADNILTPRILPRLVRPANEAAVRSYLESPAATDAQLAVKVAVALMYACGLRLSEVLALRGSDFDFPRRLIHVTGKGQKERFCAYDASFEQLFLYFVGGSTGPIFDHPVEATFRWAIIKAIQVEGRGIHPHQIRHLYACRCLENGMPIKTLSLLLGHASVKTTERYLNVDRFTLATSAQHYAPAL